MNEPAPDPKSRAAAALAARRAGIHALRMSTVMLTASVFIGAWAIVFVRLVEGHDPGLASASTSVVTQSADPAVTSDDTSGDVVPTAMTTRQS